jgi:transposase
MEQPAPGIVERGKSCYNGTWRNAMEKNRKLHTREFKVQVVKMITAGGASAAQVAQEMGIDLKTLYLWIKELSAKPDEVFPGNGELTSDAEVIRKLQLEVERLKLECAELKKSQDSSTEPS